MRRTMNFCKFVHKEDHMSRVISRRLLFTASLAVLFVALGIAQLAPGKGQDVFHSLDGATSIGDEKAPVAIVEFSDYQCSYCGEHANQVLPEIIKDYVSTGKVRYFLRDVP